MTDRDEAKIAARCDANYEEFCRESIRWSGRHGVIEERDGVLLWAGGSTFPVSSNGVIRLDPTVAADTVLDLAEDFFGPRNRGYSLSTNGYGGGDADLEAAAVARGLLLVVATPAMVCAARLAEPEVPAGITLRWIDDADGVADFVAVNDAAYQSLGLPAGVIADLNRDPARILAPHVHTVIAYEGDTPLATAQVMASHGIAGVYYVGSVEAARGRGLARLVTAAVTNKGFDEHADFVTLQASMMGEPIYLRMGYRELYRYGIYTRFV